MATASRVTEVAARLAALPAWLAAGASDDAGPLVSAVLVAGPDPEATARSMALFAAQDHVSRELVVVLTDGGGLPDVSVPVPVVPVVVESGLGAGVARDRGCAASRGDLLALWEVDAWYSAWRLRYQSQELRRTGLPVSVAASSLVWDPEAGEGWAGNADPYALPPRVFAATACLARTEWVARPFAGRGMHRADGGNGPLLMDMPSTPRHVPHGSHPAVIVRPGAYRPEVAQNGYPPGTIELVLAAGAGTGRDAVAGPGEGTAKVAFSGTDEGPAAAAMVVGRGGHSEGTGPWTALPLVSCVMPTFNRRRFIQQTVRLLARQDYPHLELVVVDDGTEPVEDLLSGFPRVKYVRLGERATIGRKRDIAVEAASGEIVVQWDDDDWYGPHRVSRQVMEIIRGRVDVTGIGINLLLDVQSMRFWSVREDEADAPHFAPSDILAAGTLSFPTELWRRAGGYPDLSIGEDVGIVQRFADAGARVAAISNRAAYVYVRHGRNSWRFDFEPANGPPAWHPAQAPPAMSAGDLAFYASLTPGGAL